MDNVPTEVARSAAVVETRVLAVVGQLAWELQRGRKVALDVQRGSDLDSDLGLDSLARAELLHRLEREFRVRLPEQLLAEAATPSDLIAGVLKAKPSFEALLETHVVAAEQLPAATEPTMAKTLLEVLEAHVRAHGERPHIHMLEGDDQETVITYGDLDRSARAAAAGLVVEGVVSGAGVAIMLPSSRDFFVSFFAVLMAGGIPVPVYPPFRPAQIEDHMRRQAGILRNAGASLLITNAQIRPLAMLLKGLVADLRTISTVDDLSSTSLSVPVRNVAAEDTALIQYTSGSTGDPKGVVLSHANLLANIRAMGEAMQATSQDRFVSWLPLYHDMGLIGAWLGSLYYGVPAAIMSPLSFLAKPSRWLWSMHRHRATLSAAPNFAFELCLRNIRDEDINGLDLSSVRMIANGAEPVSPGTIARFSERFGRYGFRPEAMAPVYGLAESSVGLAFPPMGRAPIIDRVVRERLARDGEAVQADREDKTALEFVACGRALPGHQIRIVDESGRELPDRRQGRLELKGPSATKGYFRNDEKTKQLFDGEWLDSGDLAYTVDGDVYLTGRIKDMIIRAGRNIYPAELEEAVGTVEGVRKGCVAVFASRDERAGSERLVVMAETRMTEPGEREALRARIVQVAVGIIDMPPDEIALVGPRTVPKTSSGKIRRSAARALFESGELEASSRAVWLQLARLAFAGGGTRVRRVLRRSGELAYAAYWWAALAMAGIVVWPLVMILPHRIKRQAVVGTAGRWFLRATGISLEVEGGNQLVEGGAVIVANHASYIDGLVLCAVLPGELTFVAKHGFRSRMIVGPFLERLGTLFVHRLDPRAGVQETETVANAVRVGKRVVIMPEGTFARMPGLLPFRLGAFSVAAQARVPVFPVTIRGTRMVLRDVQWFPRRGAIAVHIGAPVRCDGSDFAAAVRLRDAVRRRILERLGEPDLEGERIALPED